MTTRRLKRVGRRLGRNMAEDPPPPVEEREGAELVEVGEVVVAIVRGRAPRSRGGFVRCGEPRGDIDLERRGDHTSEGHRGWRQNRE
jgi:hypothetical protein